MAPDSTIVTGRPSGPSGSTITGTLPFGFRARKAGAFWSPLRTLTVRSVYAAPSSSRAIGTLTELGVANA